MSGRYLLDTNIAVQVLNNQLDLEAQRDRKIQLFVSLTVVGELCFGAANSGRPESNKQRIEGFLSVCPMISQDLRTAELYGDIKAELRKKGRPIPENDVWIAACALQHGLILVTRDRHFDQIDGLQAEAW